MPEKGVQPRFWLSGKIPATAAVAKDQTDTQNPAKNPLSDRRRGAGSKRGCVETIQRSDTAFRFYGTGFNTARCANSIGVEVCHKMIIFKIVWLQGVLGNGGIVVRLQCVGPLVKG